MIDDEGELVQQMLAGNPAAMEQFADDYFPGLYRFALRRLRGDRELAREIVQATACKSLAKLASFRGEAPLFTWLCSCCRNEIAMYFRRERRLPPPVELDETVPLAADRLPNGRLPDGGFDSPDRAFARREIRGRVHEALEHLPPRYARALEWKYLEQMPVREIAERLCLSSKATESLLTRARKAFREGYDALTCRPAARVVALSGRRESLR